MTMELVHRYTFDPETYTGTFEEIEYFVKVFTPILSDYEIRDHFFTENSFKDSGIELSELNVTGSTFMIMHREEWPYTVVSFPYLLGLGSGLSLHDSGVYNFSVINSADHVSEKISFESPAMFLVNITFSLDRKISLDLESDFHRIYKWYAKVDLWYDSDSSIEEFLHRFDVNTKNMGFFINDFVNSFDSYEGIDVNIGHFPENCAPHENIEISIPYVERVFW